MPPPPLSRLCVHTATTKPWSLRQAIDGYRAAGVGGITVWRDALAPQGVEESARMLRDSGLAVVSLCRGGFFPAVDSAGRQRAIDDNRRAIDEAAAIGAPLVVLVCGAVPGQPLAESRRQIADGIAAVEPHARARAVKLAVEPLHPMYAADRSAISTLRQARELCDVLGSDQVGIAVDVYHCWWDPDLDDEIARIGAAGRLLAFHLCDWRVDTRHLLTDRGLMGEGCIDLKRIRASVETAGFSGWNEVEIFSTEKWATDQQRWLEQIVGAYRKHC
jgi:sugar phosphate isomerase/epimerase